MSDSFYDMVDNFSINNSHIGAQLEDVDEYNRPTFLISVDLRDYLLHEKLGRRLRALYLFLDVTRQDRIQQRIEPSRNEDRNWMYNLVVERSDIHQEIKDWARSSTHYRQIVSQLDYLLDRIQTDITNAAQSIKENPSDDETISTQDAE